MASNLFTFVKSRIQILDVASEYAALKKAGGYYKGPCPFHSERTASFTVSPLKEIFYCFGCHVTGDVIGFIEKAEHCAPLDAAKFLIERYQLEVPPELLTAAHGSSSSDERKRFHELYATVAAWTHEQLLKTPIALNYFIKRGFTAETLKQWSIGYLPGGPGLKLLISHLATKKFLIDDLLNWHLVEQGRQMLYSPFEERLLFPIKDQVGRMCGFGGRVFREKDERAKYYNSREHDFFIKGSLLFGFDMAKSAMHQKGTVFLVEGYTDCIAMAQAGYTNTVATLGTACTSEHLKLLSRHVHTVYVLYDGDAAGQKAMLRLAELCWEVNLELKVITLPPGQDPASVLAGFALLPAGTPPCTPGFVASQQRNQGTPDSENIVGPLDQYIAQAKDLFTFYIDSLGTGFTQLPLAEKLKIGHKIISLLRNITEPLKQGLLLQQASGIMGVPTQIVLEEVRLEKRSSHKVEGPPISESTKNEEDEPSPELPLIEKKLASAILSGTLSFEKVLSANIISTFSPQIQLILQARMAQPECGLGEFIATLPAEQQQLTAQLILSDEEDIRTIEQLFQQFQKKQWQTQMHDLRIALATAQAERNEARVQELLAKFEELKHNMRQA